MGNGKVYVEELWGKIAAPSSAFTSLLRILPALRIKNRDLFHLCFRVGSNYVVHQLQCAVFKQ